MLQKYAVLNTFLRRRNVIVKVGFVPPRDVLIFPKRRDNKNSGSTPRLELTRNQVRKPGQFQIGTGYLIVVVLTTINYLIF